MDSKLTRREFLRYAGMGSAAAVLTACTPQTPVPPPTGAPVPPSTVPPTVVATIAPKTPEALTLPIVKEPLTLTYWAPMNANVAATMKSFGDIACQKELEKRTGIHFDFQHPPLNQDQQKEQFNLVMASGKYPDVIEYNWLTASGGPAKYLKDGVILRLNDLIDQNAPNLKKVLADRPDIRRMLVTDEGDIYCFPFLRLDPVLCVSEGLAIRADWLDKLGLKVPTTIDEWHDVLKAFKEKDPNGNGKADEIPFNTWKSRARGAFERFQFVGAWGIGMGGYNADVSFYQDKGVVKYSALQPEFKEFLKVMTQWYKEGLFDPDIFTTDQKRMDAKVTNNQLGAAALSGGSGIGKYMPLMTPKDPKFRLVGAPYPTLKAGDKPQLGIGTWPYYGDGSVVITSSNKHVVETVKLLDYGYSREGGLLYNFGIEGVSYTMVDGKPIFTPEVMKNPQGLPPAQAIAKYARSINNGPFVQDPGYIMQYYELPEQKDALKIWMEPTNEKRMPPVTPTQDESKKFATIMADIDTRFDEVFNKVWSGALPLDAWDTFVKDLKQMGIDDAIKIQQAALDRYNKRA
jgi:putative aldouronate transport system substrate-binding protein